MNSRHSPGGEATTGSMSPSIESDSNLAGSNRPESSRDELYRRIGLRVVPLAALGYIVAYIDRVNVGFAKLGFVRDLSFSDTVYGVGAGLFFAGYFLLELPSNLLLEYIGARKTLARIMVLWGVISAATAFIKTPEQFYIMRFALGAAEAGFFPGIILYLSYWFPAARRGRITALFVMGASLAGVLGNPLSGWLMSLDGLHGLRGWQVLLVYEALPAVVLGIVYFFFITDRPEHAPWLSENEKKNLLEDLAADTVTRDGVDIPTRIKLLHIFRDPKVYMLALAYLSILAGTQTVALWAPTLLRELGVGMRSIGFLGALPFIVSTLSMYLVGTSSDRHMERRWHFCIVIWAAALSLAALKLGDHSVAITVALLSIIAAGCWSAVTVLWTIPAALLSTEVRSGGIAFISSAGAIGGLLSPLIIGFSNELAGGRYIGFAIIGAMLGVSGLIVLLFVPKPPRVGSFPSSNKQQAIDLSAYKPHED